MTSRHRFALLVAECQHFPEAAAEVLGRVIDVRLADLDRSQLLASVGDASALWVRLRHRIDAEMFAAAPSLRLIASATTGLDHIDLDLAAKRGVRVVSLRGEREFLSRIRATAEHTIGLMIALLRRIPASLAHVREGGWNRELFLGSELFGRTVGVVGHGRLGRTVSGYLAALGAEVLTTDPSVGAGDVEPRACWVSLPELLERSSLVTLHVDLQPENRGFFGDACFRAMPRGSFFVNTSRGDLVDEIALLAALDEGHLAGAALDVLRGEATAGMAGHPVVVAATRHDRLLVTPHIGGYTRESLESAEVFLAHKVATVVGETSWQKETELV